MALNGLAVVIALVLAAAAGLDRLPFDAWSGILTLTALVALTIPVLNWLGRSEEDRGLARLLMWGMAATVAGVLVRYFFVTVVYNDSADAGRYSAGAGQLASLIKQGTFTTVPPGLESFPAESQRIGLVLYLITGTSRWAGSIVFAWLAFGGRLLMWRALRRAVPEADHKRYLMLLLFFPSLVYWPASIGKEALMILALGVVSFAAAQLLAERVSAGRESRAWSEPSAELDRAPSSSRQQFEWRPLPCSSSPPWWCSARRPSFLVLPTKMVASRGFSTRPSARPALVDRPLPLRRLARRWTCPGPSSP